MVDSRIPAGNYPFSTQDGKAIPLDILKTKGLIIQEYNIGSDALITIPAEAEIAVLIASQDCIISVGEIVGPIVNNTLKAKAYYIPKATAVTITVEPGSCYVRGHTLGGVLSVQLIERWVGMGLDTNYIRR